ncbi:uncharacterized protein LOC131248959 [Magnolia sinica]|uniref:uncharacterized protein LOC131248959 n=1 Tax=Magnolia sinica TaxID=86752 RepID=UPI0026582EE3|nr:uncharacterized protein LOC131248959 [Magnolia sinica]
MDEAIIWNARGVGNLPTQDTLAKFINKFKSSLLAILEPMLRDSKIVGFGLKLGFHSSFSNVGGGGKIWVFHKNDLNILIASLSNQLIYLLVNVPTCREPILFSIVYAKWDFNAILSSDERLGSATLDAASAEEFMNTIQEVDLLDAGFSGNSFTWSNNKAASARIWARLDRVFISDS